MSTITVFPARTVITMDPGRPRADAVAVLDGRVLSTGSLETMAPWLERHPHVIDDRFRDKVIMPGFIDPHTHFALSSGYLALQYVGPIDFPGPKGLNIGLPSLSDVMEMFARLDREIADPAEPIIAWGLDPASQGGHLDIDLLDKVSPQRPIWVISYAPHYVYVNSAALRSIDRDKIENTHGVGRFADGRLNGQFVEIAAIRLALGAMSARITREGGEKGLQRMGELARRAGITTTGEMIFGLTDFEVEWDLHRKVVAKDSFPLRMALVPLEQPLHAKYGDGIVEFLQEVSRQNSEKLFFHGIKFLSDGSFPAMSLRLTSPGYLDGGNGLRNDVPWDELHERMLPFWRAGIQIHCHANGDEAIDASLDALGRLQLAIPRLDHRFTLEHYCISRPDQARRLKALGGLASVNNYFVHYRSQLHSRQGFGPDRSEAVARLGSLEREGVIFALHSDFSLVVAPMHPLTAVWIAVQRIAADGVTVLAPGERIGLDRALRAITIDAAYVLGLERKIGTIEPGKFADFAILESDPYETPPDRIPDIQIWGTVLAGVPQGPA